jgi:adenylylsulfate kinase
MTWPGADRAPSTAWANNVALNQLLFRASYSGPGFQRGGEAGMAGQLVLWVTGLSGAGKTSVSRRLRERCAAAGRPAVLLDGDSLRAILGDRFGHAPEDRRYLAMCYGRLCRELAQQGITVICATISMFDAVRAWNREHIPGYREIYLRVPQGERQRRDVKGVYGNDVLPAVCFTREGFEEPRTPDLIIDNHGAISADQAAETIWAAFLEEHRP